MSARTKWVAALAALALAGPALAADSNANQAEKQQAFAQAPFAVAGTIVAQPANGMLVLKPYGQDTQTTMQWDQSAPIFQGNGKITAAGLRPGVDVRVHYRPDAAQPHAMAVEVLNPQEAQLAKQQPQKVATAAPPATPVPQASPGVQAAPVPAPFKAQAVKNASGNQTGKVAQVSGGTLVLDPYQKAAGNATLKLEPNTPIFRGNEQLSTNALTPGTDVRVFYKNHGSDRPSVVAIELLNPQDAQQLQKSERDIPRGK